MRETRFLAVLELDFGSKMYGRAAIWRGYVAFFYEDVLSSLICDPEECSTERDGFHFYFVDSVRVDAVQFQKRQGGVGGGAFVAIDEAVILCKVKQVRGSHFRQGLVEVFAPKMLLRLRDRRLDKCDVPNAI